MDTFTLKPGTNTGFMPVGPDFATDFMAGGESALLDQVRVPGGDWRPYISPGEWQRDMNSYFETDACVSFGANDVLETDGNFEIANGNWDQADVQWLRDNGYFNPDGTLNFSDRFTAKMSGTTMQYGNSLPAVWNSIKNNGLVPESMWPFPFADLPANSGESISNWNIYYAQPSAKVIAMGQEFLKRFKPQFEWCVYPGSGNVSQQMLKSMLSIAPMQIATAVCPPWNTSDVIRACGPGSQHCTALINEQVGVQHDILDHYVPFVKHFAADYSITYGMRGVLIPIAQAPVSPQTFHYTFQINILYGAKASDPDVRQLQTALQTLRRPNGKTYMTAGVYGPFGPLTANALVLFQQDHGISDPQPGHHFGPSTRAAMNKALAAL